MRSTCCCCCCSSYRAVKIVSRSFQHAADEQQQQQPATKACSQPQAAPDAADQRLMMNAPAAVEVEEVEVEAKGKLLIWCN